MHAAQFYPLTSSQYLSDPWTRIQTLGVNIFALTADSDLRGSFSYASFERIQQKLVGRRFCKKLRTLKSWGAHPLAEVRSSQNSPDNLSMLRQQFLGICDWLLSGHKDFGVRRVLSWCYRESCIKGPAGQSACIICLGSIIESLIMLSTKLYSFHSLWYDVFPYSNIMKSLVNIKLWIEWEI